MIQIYLHQSIMNFRDTKKLKYELNMKLTAQYICRTLFKKRTQMVREGWGIPSEKIGQNIHPPESRFFVINYQAQAQSKALRKFPNCQSL